MAHAQVDAVPMILRDQAAGVVTLTLNRGERFNPLSSAMIAALAAELDAIAGDPSAQVVILAAGGRGFCAGHDLKEMRAHAGDKAWQRQLFDQCGRMMTRLTTIPQPVIARVHGIATAAGCQLVSMCDLAVASDSATFALPGVNIGVFCSTPAVGVARNISRKRAMEMLLTGEMIDAATALEFGLVNRVVPSEALSEVVSGIANTIAAKSPLAVKLGKQAVREQAGLDLANAYESASRVMVENMLAADAEEGISAFFDKRPPTWG